MYRGSLRDDQPEHQWATEHGTTVAVIAAMNTRPKWSGWRRVQTD